MGNRAAEEACLNKAIELALKQRGWTKKLAKSLQAGLREGFKKVDRDRPDFVVLCPPITNGKKVLIGIENFRVDAHVIQKKTNAVASTAVVEQKYVNEFYHEHRDKVLNAQPVPQETLNDLAELLRNQIDVEQKATYGNFVASFEYGLKKHIEHTDAYWENLSDICGNNDVKLGLLVEIHGDFDHLYLWRDGKTRKGRRGYTPILDNIVALIEEKVDTSRFSFAILYFAETLDTERDRVVVVQTKAIREQLKKQNEPVYKYAGEDFRLKAFELPYVKSESSVTCEVDKTDSNKFEISMALTETPIQDKAAYLFAATYKALECEKKGIPYATTKGVLFIIELLRNNVCCWERSKTPGKEWMVYPILKDNSKEMFDERSEAFKKRWGDGGQND